jgi:hypothetical protein
MCVISVAELFANDTGSLELAKVTILGTKNQVL